ncbi:hypothetical protein JCM8208_006534 [Rhodotorula glutinis]
MPSPPVQSPAHPIPAAEWPYLPMSALVQMRNDVVSVAQPASQLSAATLAVLSWIWAQERAELHAQFAKRAAVNPPLMFSMLRSAGITCLHDLALATWNLPASNPILHEALHDVALPTELQQLTLFVQPGPSPDADSPMAVPRHLLERILDCANNQVLSWAEIDGHRRRPHSDPPRATPGVLLCPRCEVEPGPAGPTLHWIMSIVRHHLELVKQPPSTVNLGVAPPPILVHVPAIDSTSAAQDGVTFPTLSASMLLTYELRNAHAAVCVFNIFLLGQVEQEARRAEAHQGSHVPFGVASARTACHLDDFRRVARSYLLASPEYGSVDTFFEWLRQFGSPEWRGRLVSRCLGLLSGYWPSIEAVVWPEAAPGQVPVAQPDMYRRAGHLFARFSHVLTHVHDLAHPVDGPVVAGPSVYEPQSRHPGNA